MHLGLMHIVDTVCNWQQSDREGTPNHVRSFSQDRAHRLAIKSVSQDSAWKQAVCGRPSGHGTRKDRGEKEVQDGGIEET